MSLSIVNLHGTEHPQYRLGDAVLKRDTSYGKQAFERATAEPSPFPGSLLDSYARLINHASTDPQWKILRAVTRRRTADLRLELPRTDELVVHLRLGNAKGFDQPVETFVDYLTQMRTAEGFERLTIVSAIHFGALYVAKHRESAQVESEISEATSTVARIIEELVAAGLDVQLRSNDEIDDDFCYLAGARRMVLGNGHFSLCAAMVSEATVFVPPWARSGAEVDVDQLLQSRSTIMAPDS